MATESKPRNSLTSLVRSLTWGKVQMASQLDLTAALKGNESLLDAEEENIAKMLLNLDQAHLFEKWAPPGIEDELKHQFFAQVKSMHASYPGGLPAYVQRARDLLARARDGINPLDGWTPSVPVGEVLQPGSSRYTDLELIGLTDVGKCGFVLVAGGLGERLGYSGIKLELPCQTITHVTYLQLYIEQILTFQYSDKFGGSGLTLPLAIMVSDDTLAGTKRLLEDNNYFGMKPEQVTLMKQEKVPALLDNSAHMSTINPYTVESKPHGHGDVHTLMYSTGTASKWEEDGIQWVVFFQDTNGLAFYTLPAMLGVSKSLDLQVNSLAIPRKAKQAVGAITKLSNTAGQELTVNVEYNQLDPLLRASGFPEGDVNDTSGFSPFPGNINQLLFRLAEYVQVLDRTQGAMDEFVNPKYADESRTVFKKPTRLECMMQDYPKLLRLGGPAPPKVGFTTAPAWLCFSPVKNNVADAAAAAKYGIPPGSAATGEADQLQVGTKILQSIGVRVSEGEEVEYQGIPATLTPATVFHPSFLSCPHDAGRRFPHPLQVRLTARSVLIVKGDVVIESLQLDGALYLTANPGCTLYVRAGVVRNDGFEIVPISADDPQGTEVTHMRGYIFQKAFLSEAIAMGNGEFVYNGESTVTLEQWEQDPDLNSTNGAGSFCFLC